MCKTTTVTKVGQCSGRPEHRRGGLGVGEVGAGEGGGGWMACERAGQWLRVNVN